jgi:hypothetical protein
MIVKLVRQHARPIVLGTAFLLMIDLFFHWRAAPVHTQWVDTGGGTSAMVGWGGVVFAVLFVLLVIEAVTNRRGRTVATTVAIAAAVLTFVEFFAGGSATVTRIDGVVAQHTLWPAYAGLALAVLLVLASVNRLFAPPAARLPLPPAPPGAFVNRSAPAGTGTW